MSGKKETRPGAPTPRRAVESGTDCKTAHTSTTNCTTTGGSGQMVLIASLLSTGQCNAVPLRHLKLLTGLPGREVRKLIEKERRAGALILSDNQRGYYLAADAEEVSEFVRSMRHRAAQILLTAMYTERAVKNWNKTP